MHKRVNMILACFAVLLCSLAVADDDSEQPLNGGVAVVNITPPVGFRRAGNFHEIITTGVRDSLYARALVLQQGESKCALVFCDLTAISRDCARTARQRAAELTGIPVAHILIAATHAHTAPLYFGLRRELFHKQALQQYQGYDPHEVVDYPGQLTDSIVRAVVLAQAEARPIQLASGVTWQTGLSFHRRFYMQPGSESLRDPGSKVRMNPGRDNPDIIRPAGPIDPSVGVLLLTSIEKNKPVVSLVNFALHLDTVGGTEFSADYPYYLEQALQQMYGKQFTSIFGIGACGELNHIDVTSDHRLTTVEIGTSLAETVKKQLPWLEPVIRPQLAIRHTRIDVPLQRFSAAQVEQARKDIDKLGTEALPWIEQVRAHAILEIAERNSAKMAMEVQVFRLNEQVALVGLPGEVFVELGLAIKKASPFQTTLVFELCNDAPGYIPTRQGFSEGGYEVVNSRIAPGGGEQLVDAAVALLNQLQPLQVSPSSLGLLPEAPF